MSESVVGITTPVGREILSGLRHGDRVLLSGDILVFRDQVHLILCEMIGRGESLPFDLTGAVLYYCGPTPGRDGMPVGSAGPTTASRMDKFTEPLLERGLAATIGKGNRSPEVTALLEKYGAVYFAAVGGAGAYLGKKVKKAEIVAFSELGPEAARVFTVDDMPLIVGIDSMGGSAFV